MSWAEIARRIGTSPYTVWRWVEGGVRPHFRHLMALLELAEDLGLSHILIAWNLMGDAPSGQSGQPVPPRHRN